LNKLEQGLIERIKTVIREGAGKEVAMGLQE